MNGNQTKSKFFRMGPGVERVVSQYTARAVCWELNLLNPCAQVQITGWATLFETGWEWWAVLFPLAITFPVAWMFPVAARSP